jgi:hypothetical protein
MYTVFKQLENGDFVHVASRDGIDEAMQLAHDLNVHWPGKYEVCNSRSELVRSTSSVRNASNSDAKTNSVEGHHLHTHYIS